MKVLRRSRWLAALLLIASPAVGGQVLPAIHPCPVATGLPDAPDDHQDHNAGLLSADQGDHSGSGHQADCTCIGNCQPTPGQVAPGSAPVVRAATYLVDTSVPPLLRPEPPIARPIDRLPPTTAPPLA